MNKEILEIAVAEIKAATHHAVTTASYNGNTYTSGLEAKTALTRSAGVIYRIHEATKISLHNELKLRKIAHEVHPSIGKNSPEMDVWGLLKKKKQDVVVTVGKIEPIPESIMEGPMIGQVDRLGSEATKNALVVGVRSQLSSVDKNFDTLMERAFAETLNLRLRHPYLVMGEVYMLAVKDYDEQLMKNNQIGWKIKYTNIERFISIFNAMSGRDDVDDIREAYKYERSVLLLVDFSIEPPKIYWTIEELRADGIVSDSFSQDYTRLSPKNFAKDLLDAYAKRHSI